MARSSLAEREQEITALLLTAEDDTNEAPWMTMPEFQFQVIHLLVAILRLYSGRRHRGWHVSAELGVRMPKPDGTTLTLGPDLFVVEADPALRTSWDIVGEGQPPRFVLEVVTKDSVTRDTTEKQKVGYYAAMGVTEYAIYWPERQDGGPKLFGYRRDAAGEWVAWNTDGQGVLWCTTLAGLGLYIEALPWLRLVDQHGVRLPSPEEEAERAEREAERAEREAERAEREAAARRAAEAEVARLLALLEAKED
jgi:Uma2 family endonuclease